MSGPTRRLENGKKTAPKISTFSNHPRFWKHRVKHCENVAGVGGEAPLCDPLTATLARTVGPVSPAPHFAPAAPPRACGKRLPPWETRAVLERVPALDSFVKGSTDPRAASCPHQHTHTHHRIAVPVLHRMPARPCCCGSDLGSVDSPAPTHPGRNFSRKRAPHSASPAPLRASGDSLSAFCMFGTDEPLPASREAGTAACAPRKLTPTKLLLLPLPQSDALWIDPLQGGDWGGRNQGLPQGQGACCHLLWRRLVWLLQAVPRSPRPGEIQVTGCRFARAGEWRGKGVAVRPFAGWRESLPCSAAPAALSLSLSRSQQAGRSPETTRCICAGLQEAD